MTSKTFGMALGLAWLLSADAATAFAQPGPDGGAVLRNSFDDPPAARPAPLPSKSGQAPLPGSSLGQETGPSYDQVLANLTVDPRYAMNKDIEPTPPIGP